MMIPEPGVLDRLVRDRHGRLRPVARPLDAARGAGLRVRVGRLLIAAGSALAGERTERPARPPALSRATR